jgi:hypothetical protein
MEEQGLADLSLEISAQKGEPDSCILIIQAKLTAREQPGPRNYYVVI